MEGCSEVSHWGNRTWPDLQTSSFRLTFYDIQGGIAVKCFNVESNVSTHVALTELAEEHLDADSQYLAATVFGDGSGQLFAVKPAKPQKKFEINKLSPAL